MTRYVLLGFTLLLVGCGDSQTVSSVTPETIASTQPVGDGSLTPTVEAVETGDGATVNTEPDGAAAEQGVALQTKSWDELQAMIAAAKGKIVVVDLWSTSCPPCLKELPHLITLQKEHANEGVHCISVSCDYDGLDPLATYEELVLEQLREIDATITNVMLNVPSDELYPKIDLASIPAVYVYGRDGSLLKRFDNDANEYGGEGFTYVKQIIPMVERLLAEKN